MVSLHSLRQSKVVLFVSVLLLSIAMTGSVSAQSETRIVEGQTHENAFRCEPGSIPETSLLEEFREDVRRVVNPEYVQKYPDDCISWAKNTMVEANGETHSYTVSVVKYQGENQPAMITVLRDGRGLGYVDMRVDGQNIGSTNSDGRVRAELSDEFELVVETSDVDLTLYG